MKSLKGMLAAATAKLLPGPTLADLARLTGRVSVKRREFVGPADWLRNELPFTPAPAVAREPSGGLRHDQAQRRRKREKLASRALSVNHTKELRRAERVFFGAALS